MGKGFTSRSRLGIFFILSAGLMLMGPAFALADDTVCARVKIEIKQELTLERQAFDAHMRINNGFSGITLDNVEIDVSFADADGNVVPASSDPNNTDALFFIRLDSMQNISDVSGAGTVDPSSTADIHWLIIPAPGAANGLASGTLYYVGARLTYTLGGEQKTTEVTPDYIFVKPMPEITLDYFLPSDVYGDDPLTEDAVEPIVPFSLGVRVKNSGHGVAHNLKIESAQPKITENELGLLIGFAIEGSEVNGRPAADSLLADFGDIAAGSSGMARWIMTCTLSGTFVAFTADFSHSDELGGKLTSLIQAANTHFLVKDVMVDLPGRDAVRDFLAQDGSVYRVYESEAAGLGDLEVSDQSSTAALSGTGDTTRALTTAETAGFMYVQLADPFGGQKALKEVVRADGKIIKSDNFWLSHTRVKDSPWQYHLNLFDVNSPGIYTLRFEDTSAVPLPPALQYIADKTVLEGERVFFMVEASDPNGTLPALSAAPLPVGATFVDQGDGSGVFDWTPAEGQAGVYEIIYRASNGSLEAARRATIAVKGFRDADGDDLDDDWELQHFGGLERDGRGDFDHDGVSDLDEFLAETDPAGLAALTIHQAVNRIDASVGDEVIITVTAVNNGPRDATGVEVLDLLSAGLRYINDDSDGAYIPASGIWDVGSLPASAPGNTATLNITAEVTRSGKILNVAALTGADLYDPDRSDNSAALLLNGGSQADLALALVGDSLMAQAGDTIAVALTVTNNGIDDATGVEIDALLPAGLSYVSGMASQGSYNQTTGIWAVGDLSSGAGAQLLLTLTADTIDEMVLTATLTAGDQADPDPTNNRSSIVINQHPVDHPYIADLAIHKRVNHSAVAVEEQAVFTLLIRNNGPHDAGSVEIDDLLPVGLNLQSAIPSQGVYDDEDQLWQVGVIPAGALAMMDMIVAVTQTGPQDNTADISDMDEFDPDAGNDSETIGITGLAADIAVTQSVAPASVHVGENFEFTITVINHGPNDAGGVYVADPLPAGLRHQASLASQGAYAPDTGVWEIGNLANGQSATLQITARVEQSGDMTSSAARTASRPTDLNPGNDSASATVTGYAPPVVADIPGQAIDEGDLFSSIDLDGYVSDADNAPAEIAWTFSGASELTVAIDAGPHVAVISIPHPDWYGAETITFTATDPAGLSDSRAAVFTVRNVNDPPVGLGDAYDVDEDQILTVAAPGVLGNDADIDSVELSAVLLEDVKSGTLTMSSDGSFSYQPNGNFHGNDSFSYKVSDGADASGVIAVTLAVNPVNDAPIADAGGPYVSQEGTSITFDAAASSDIDNDELRFRWDFDGDGEWDTEYAAAPSAAYTWNDEYAGIVTVEAWDGNIAQTATASVSVADVAPAVTIAGAAAVDEGALYTIALSAVDPGSDTIASWAVNWGDGTAETITGDPKTASHTYADEGDYTISASATNEDGTYDAQANILVSVKNVAPAANAGADQTVDEGAAVAFAGSFADPGADTHMIEWNFGDGSTASGELSVSHVYADNGTYEVTLSVIDDENGVGTDTLTVTVNNAAPTVSAGADQQVNEGDQISFNASFSDASPADTHTAVWNFGDGSPEFSGSLTPSHVYADNGVYTATLTVTDDDGGVGTDTLIVTVDNVAPAVAAGPDGTIDEGGTFTSSGSFIDPGADQWTATVDYGDGSGVQPLALNNQSFVLEHIYSKNGSYTATVAITDSDGESGTDTAIVTVNNVAPTVVAGPDGTIDEGGMFTSSGSFTDPGADTWTATVDYGYGSGTQALDLNDDKSFALSHRYSDNGSYTVTITISDSDGESGTDTATVKVNNVAPTATAGPDQTVDEGAAVAFAGSFADPGADTHTIEWNFGDGNTVSGELSVSHAYADNGTYEVTLTVTDDENGVGTDTLTVMVNNVAPTVAAGEDLAAVEGAVVAFAGTFSDPGADTWTATVDYGDNAGSEEFTLNADKSYNFSHTYVDDGTYAVTVTVTDDEGTTGTDSLVVEVADVAPQITLNTDPAPSDEASRMTLGSVIVDPGRDGYTLNRVDWGDGTFDDNPAAAVHIYADNGSYEINAAFTEDDAAATVRTVSITHAVSDVAPAVSIAGPGTVDEGSVYSLALSAVDPGDDTIVSWDVNWGDGAADTVQGNPSSASHVYADNGEFTISASATNEDGTYAASAPVAVAVNNVAPTVAAGPDGTVDEGGTFTSSGSFTDPGADQWTATVDYGDGSGVQALVLNSEMGFGLSHMYTENGSYTVTVTISDDEGAAGSDTAIVTVNNVAPTANAGADQAVDEGAAVSFAGSFTDPGTDSHTIQWDFGDGSSDSGSLTPSHSYADNGVYTVTLTVADDDGGVGTDTLAVTINNAAPTVSAGADQKANEGDEVAFSGSFSDASPADTHTAVWNFGDGSPEVSGSLTPLHTYGDNGIYTVTLKVTDDDGGIGTSSLAVVVGNSAPVLSGLTSNSPANGEIELTAAFVDPGWLDTHTGVCQFGDGTAAAGADIAAEHEKPEASGTLRALHTYTAEGMFTVSVTVTDDDGAGSEPGSIAVLIDKTAPAITVFEPQAGYYRNTDDIMVDVAVEDPESGGVSSGLVAAGVVVTLDGRPIETDELLDLSELANGFHTLCVSASDYAGNSAEQEVSFEVGPAPALVHIEPHAWDLKWLDPFDNYDSQDSKNAIKAQVSLENAEVETIIPTDNAAKLKIGGGFGDFVVVDVVAAQTDAKPGKEKVASLTLKYVGVDEMDILAFSGNTVLDFFSVNADDTIAIDSGPAGNLDNYTVLSSYQSDPPLLSAADIIAETVLLNQWVPIIEGSARLITTNAATLAQSGVIAEPPYGIVKEKKHHVWLANLGQPQQMTLEVGSRTIFADEPYPVNWQDWFSLDDDGPLQMMRIHVSEKDSLLQVLHHNLRAEARIYLDGALALTILPETNWVALEVSFNRFDVMSTIDRGILQRGGDWLVTAHNGAILAGKHPRNHISLSDIGHPQKARLVIGDTVVFDDQSFPINWSQRYLIVDGQRQDLSIGTHGAKGHDPRLEINCKKLTHEARLYLDDTLVLLISPPPEVAVTITGELELDGDPATFDGAFRGTDAIELKGKLPQNFDPPMSYQRINTSGEPALQIGRRFGDFELVGFTEDYDDWRIMALEFSCGGFGAQAVNFYEDPGRKHPVGSYQADAGEPFSIDLGELAVDRLHLEVGKKHADIKLTGKQAVEIGDSFLDCSVTDISKIPLGPPHYIDLTLEYAGAIDAIALTAYDGKPKNVVGTYQVDSDMNPVFTIDGSGLPRGYLGEKLVLEYGPVE